MISVVYLLCAGTSAICAILLLLKYYRSRQIFLFLSGLCFVGFAINNALLFIDLVALPEIDLSIIRTLPGLIGIAFLLWGFVWDSV